MKKIIYGLVVFLLTYNIADAAQKGEAELKQASENANKLGDFFKTEMLINILFAIIAIIMTLFISKIINGRIIAFAEKNGDSENREELVGVMTRTANISVLTIGFTITLSILGIDMGIFLGGLGFGIGFTLKIFLSNFIAGIIMVTQGSYHNGDIIKLGEKIGTIKKINSLFTEVEQFDGVIFYIPNVKFLENEVENFHTNDKRRVEISIGVDYETDIVKAKKIMIQIVENFPGILKAPGASVYITDFNNSSINLSLRFWISSKGEYFAMKSNVTETINMGFRQHGIKIPFKQITLSNRSDFKINMSTNK